MDVHYAIFGETQLRVDGHPVPMGSSAKVRGMLAVLLLHASRPVPFTDLVRWMWDSNDLPDGERTTIHNYGSRIRAVFKQAGLTAPLQYKRANDSYVMNVNPLRVDYHHSRDLFHRGRQAAAERNHALAQQLLADAVEPWHHPLVADLRTERAEDARHDKARLEMLPAYYALIDSELALRRPQDALTRLNELLIEHEFDEQLIERKMIALDRAEQHYQLTEFFLHAKRRTEERLSMEFSPRLDELFGHLLRQRAAPLPVPAATPAPAAQAVEPASETGYEDDGIPPVADQIPPGIRDFVGRTTELAVLDNVLEMADLDAAPTVRLITVDGPPGIGKSSLVTHWANQARAQFPDGRFHLDLNGFGPGDPVDPGLALGWLLHALGVPGSRVPLGCGERTALLRTITAGKRLLLVLDNARDSRHVRPLLPSSPSCMVIVTSRTTLTGLRDDHGALTLTVRPLPTADSEALLAHMITPARGQDDPEAFCQLAAQCDGFPLALRISGGHALTHPHARLAELVSELADYQDLLDPVGADDTTSLQAVFTWSYDLLTPTTQTAFRFLSVHPGREISVTAAAALLDTTTQHANRELRVLAGANLLDHAPHNQRYRFHDLVRAFARTCLANYDTPTEQDAARLRILDFYLHSADNADHQQSPHRPTTPIPPLTTPVRPMTFATEDDAGEWLRHECVNLCAATRMAAEHELHGHTWSLPALIRDTLERQAHHDECLTLHALALDAVRALGNRDAEATTLNNLGVTCLRLHHNTHAAEHLTRGLELSREIGSRDLEAACLHNLGVTHTALGHPGAARDFFHHALALREDTGDRYGQAYTLHRLATLHHKHLGQPNVAITLYEHATAIHTSLNNLAGIGDVLTDRAALHHDLGDHAQAVEFCHQALLVHQTTHDQRRALDTHLMLARAEMSQHHQDKAIQAAQDAVALGEVMGNHHAITQALQVLADALDAAGLREQADLCRDRTHPSLAAPGTEPTSTRDTAPE